MTAVPHPYEASLKILVRAYAEGLTTPLRAIAARVRNMDELMTIPEVAAMLRVSRSFAYQLVQRGDIAAVRMGRRCRRVRRSDLERFIADATDERTSE